MNSDDGNGCSHPLGFPIRKSPDHGLLAASRSFSQLITSFFAYLRQGIHTHALSSLTIKSTTYTRSTLFQVRLLVFSYARQIFSCQRSRLPQQSANLPSLRTADLGRR